MVTRFMLRPPNSLPFTFLSPPRFVPNPLFLSFSLHSATPTATATATATTADQILPYGPSLRKGHKPFELSKNQSEEAIEQVPEDTDDLLDTNSFTRAFDIAALRVTSDRCFALENRLRGHLLNWPRIRNIARVPGDEVDGELNDCLKHRSDSSNYDGDSDGLVALNRRIHGRAEGDGELLPSVLYRDKLVKTFNTRGFVKFRNLARMSRPKKRKKKEEAEGRDKSGRNVVYMVEVVEDGSGSEEEEGEDFSGLLGDEFKGRKWRGSTRLLLLDEQYADNRVEDMPEAIKAVAKEDGDQSTTSALELVRCRLTLFYNYWQMDEILEALLPKDMIIPSAFETVGHIAHLNLRDEHLPHKRLIAKVVLDKHKPKIQTVVNKISSIQNDYRTMQLEVLAGNHSLVATVVENGLRFHVDLAAVYWNSKLSTERQRLLSCFSQNDVVCDVFAGVGPIAISAAKKVKHVYANDLNPCAVDYLERNCVLNKLERKVEVYNMDGRRFIDAIFTNQKARPITQVVMNLPNDAAEYLDAFRGIFRKIPNDKEITLPTIHVYGFSKGEDPEFDFHERIRIALSEVAFEVKTHRVRLVAPGKWMICASFILPERVAVAKVHAESVS